MPSRRHSRHTGPMYRAIKKTSVVCLTSNFDLQTSNTGTRFLSSDFQSLHVTVSHPKFEVQSSKFEVRNGAAVLYPAPFRRSTAVVRDRRHVANRLDVETHGLQRADRR